MASTIRSITVHTELVFYMYLWYCSGLIPVPGSFRTTKFGEQLVVESGCQRWMVKCIEDHVLSFEAPPIYILSAIATHRVISP